MKSFISNLFLVTVLVALSVKHGLSIKCYDCKTTLLDGTTDDACRDQFGKSLTRECESSVCSIVVKSLDNGKGSITRGCGSKSNGTVIGAETTSVDHGQYFDNGTHISWSTCMTDLCNWDVTLGHRIRRFLGLYENKNRPAIKCYVCDPSIMDRDDKCTQGIDMEIETCDPGVCRIMKLSYNGDAIVFRSCDTSSNLLDLLLPKNTITENGKLTRFGAELSWSTCTTDLCNWGVTNTYQTMTLFVGIMMSVSVYYTLY